jgi:hypothetical protein
LEIVAILSLKQELDMGKKNHNPPLTEREAEVIANAESYTVTQFLGQGLKNKYEKIEALADAVSVARELVSVNKRPAMLYAIQGVRQALVCNFYADGTVSVRPDAKK